ncbi:MAG: hypothetical protein NC401_17005, partial [Ruminococcus sp.]|nr:hypothetical protein [Ruminococcus sp.]
MKFTSEVLNLSAAIENGKLIITLDQVDDLDGEFMWKVEIRHEECETHIWDYNKEPRFIYSMEKTGTYGISIIAKNGNIQYRPLEKAVHYYTPEVIKAYSDFLNSNDSSIEKEQLPLFCP